MIKLLAIDYWTLSSPSYFPRDLGGEADSSSPLIHMVDSSGDQSLKSPHYISSGMGLLGITKDVTQEIARVLGA